MSDNPSTSTTAGKGVAPDSHSALFGLEGKRPSTDKAGAGAGSGIIGTSGHAGAAKSDAGAGVSDPGNAQSTTAGMQHGGKSSALPGSGGEMLTPSQGSGEIPPKV